MRSATLMACLASSFVISVAVAGAETTMSGSTGSTAQRVLSVQGVASDPIEQDASAQSADAVYRQAMTDAIADGLSKAQLLASDTAATLGQVQSLSEGGGYIQCSGETEYEGAQPDFGSGSSEVFGASGSPVLAGRATPSSGKPAVKHQKKKHHRAKKTSAGSCVLSTQVALVYQLS
jgi:hypothetical protein